MNKHLKILIALLSSIFALAACGQNNSAGSAAQHRARAAAGACAPHPTTAAPPHRPAADSAPSSH